MIGSPFSVLIASMFCTAFLCVVLAMLVHFVPFVPKQKRQSILFLGALVASIASSAVIVAIPYMKLQLSNEKIQSQKLTQKQIQTYPWQNFGRLVKSSGLMKSCTVTLLSPTKALTPAQCMKSALTASGYALPAQLFVAFPGRETISVDEYVIGPNYDNVSNDFPVSSRDGWALIKLSTPAGFAHDKFVIPQKGTIATTYADNYKALVMPGFFHQADKNLKVLQSCRLLTEGLYGFFMEYGGRDGGYHLHDCPEWGMAVGAPLLQERQDGSYKILALHVGFIGAYETTVGISVTVSGINYETGRIPYL